jgi:DNA-binding GntR family transcriptional regulator
VPLTPDDDMRIVSESSPTRRLVTTRLTDSIIQGRFKPGERLIERELCELLGVSRTSLREALRELERDGLIENIPNKGTIVARVTLAQAQSLYEVRAVLEGLAAKLFAERATDAQVKQLEASLEALGEAAARYEPGPFIAATNAFYSLLLEGAANPTLALSLKSLHTRVSQLRLVSLQRPGRPEAMCKELKRMVRKIKARDPEQAQRESILHVENAATAALDAMRAAEAAA